MEDECEYYHNSNYNLYLKKSQITNGGIGVFTHDDIQCNEIIDEYLGDITSVSIGHYTFYIKENTYIDAYNYPRCYMAMINDGSFVPKRNKKQNNKKNINIVKEYENNCEFSVKCNRVFVKSIKEIKAGDELFISYGEDYWNCRE